MTDTTFVTKKKKYIRIASIDIGRTNFGQYIEDCSLKALQKAQSQLRNLPVKYRTYKNPSFEAITRPLINDAKRVQTGVYDFTTEIGQSLDIEARLNLLKHLSRFEELFSTCDVFIIEQQFYSISGFGHRKARKNAGGANMDAIKTAEGVFMWLLDHFPFKTVQYFGSQYKTQIFGAGRMTKEKRKKWAIEQAEKLYTLRGDSDMINVYALAEAVKRKRITTEERVESFLENFKVEGEDTLELSNKIIREKQKLDDVSDAFLQAQAFKLKDLL